MNMRANKDFAAGFCASAVSFFKLVAERGVWDDDLLTDAEAGWYSGTDRGKEIAILKWWVAAERGSEIAQNNLAYVLDQGKPKWSHDMWSSQTQSIYRPKHASSDAICPYRGIQ